MAESIGDLAVRIISDASGFLSGMAPVNQAFQTAEQGASKMGQEVSRWLDKMAADAAKVGEQMGTSLRSGLASLTGVGAIAGGLGLEQLATEFGDKLHESIVLAIDKVKREALLDIAIRNQGSIAGFSRSGLEQYATEREEQTGFGRGEIREEALILSRFTEVGGDIAKRVMTLGQDLARYVPGESLQGAATKLAELLNDPTRLRGTQKLGITGEQRTDIEAMVKMGDVEGARDKLISTLEKTLDGAAQATKGPLDDLGNEFHHLSVELGEGVLPALVGFGEVLRTAKGWVPGAGQGITPEEAARNPELHQKFIDQEHDRAGPHWGLRAYSYLLSPAAMGVEALTELGFGKQANQNIARLQSLEDTGAKSFEPTHVKGPPSLSDEAQKFLDRLKSQEARESLNPFKAAVDEEVRTHPAEMGDREKTALYGEAQKLASAEADKLIQNMVTNWSQIKDDAGVYEQTMKRINALDPNKLGPATEAFNKGQATWEAKEEARKLQEVYDRQEKQDQAAADRFQQSLKTPQDLWDDEKKQLDRLVDSDRIHDFERDAILQRDKPQSRPLDLPSHTFGTSGGFGGTGAGFGSGANVMEQVASSVKNVDRNTKEMIGELKRLKPPAAGN